MSCTLLHSEFVDGIQCIDCLTPIAADVEEGSSLIRWQECPTIDYPIQEENDISRSVDEDKLRPIDSRHCQMDANQDPFEWKSSSDEEKTKKKRAKRTKKVDVKVSKETKKTISLQKWKMRMELIDTIEKIGKEIRQIKSRFKNKSGANEGRLESGKTIERTRFVKKNRRNVEDNNNQEENIDDDDDDETIPKAVVSPSRHHNRGLRSGMLSRPFHHHHLLFPNHVKKESTFSLFRRRQIRIRNKDDKKNPEE